MSLEHYDGGPPCSAPGPVEDTNSRLCFPSRAKSRGLPHEDLEVVCSVPREASESPSARGRPNLGRVSKGNFVGVSPSSRGPNLQVVAMPWLCPLRPPQCPCEGTRKIRNTSTLAGVVKSSQMRHTGVVKSNNPMKINGTCGSYWHKGSKSKPPVPHYCPVIQPPCKHDGHGGGAAS